MPEISVTVETSPDPSLSFSSSSLPTMTGNAGKLLETNGSTASWTDEPVVKAMRIIDATFPLIELRTTGGPPDKRFVRWTQDATGLVKFARVNDAYTAESPLIYWDANNNATLGLGSLVVNGSIRGVQGTLKGAADNSAWSVVAGNSDPGAATAGAWLSFYGGTAAGSPGLLVFGCNTAVTGVITPSGNLGIGTTAPAARLHVGNGSIRVDNGNAIQLTDTGGTNPNLTCQSDNNVVFYGTTAAGAQRAIFSFFARSTTSSFQVAVPLKIGASGANIVSFLKATVTHVIGTIPAGGFVELTSTVTGAIAGAMVHVGGGSPNNLIVKGYSTTGDTVSVMYHNPSAASVSAGTRSIDLFVFNVV